MIQHVRVSPAGDDVGYIFAHTCRIIDVLKRRVVLSAHVPSSTVDLTFSEHCQVAVVYHDGLVQLCSFDEHACPYCGREIVKTSQDAVSVL
jgi:hypothetical protein